MMKKTDESELERLMSLDYNVIVKEANDVFYLLIPELSLTSEDQSLETAYRDLGIRKATYFRHLVMMGETGTLVEPPLSADRKGVSSSLKIFAARAFILTVCFVIAVIGIHPVVDAIVSSKVKELPRVAVSWVGRMATKVDLRLSNLSSEERDSALVVLRQRVGRLKPFFDEVKVLWRDVPPEPSQARE